jgi:hypothetical protein
VTSCASPLPPAPGSVEPSLVGSLRSIWSFLATFRNIAAAALEALIVAVTAIDKAIVGARQDPPCRPRPAAGLYY